MKFISRITVFMAMFGAAGQALAKRISKGEDGQLGLMEPATPIMEQLTEFHDMLLIITTAITVFVALLLLWVMIRYNRRANPEPSKVSHNTVIEIVWTAVPILILAAIFLPSLKLLYAQDVTPEAGLVVKATGHQWYWSYEYPDHDGMSFDAIMLEQRLFDDPAAADDRRAVETQLADFLNISEPPVTYRLLDTDTRIVVPVNTVVKMLVTASDVLHSWTIPAFGIKVDAVPGRLNETWFKATEVGTYYGQCSEICGIRHSFMPIVVEVVSQREFDAWLEKTKQEYAAIPDSRTRLAMAAE